MERMMVVFYASRNVALHYDPADDRSPTFWRHFRGTPVEDLLDRRGNGVYEVEFGSEGGRLRTINLIRRLGNGWNPELRILVLVGSGKETFFDPSDPELAYLGGKNGRYGTVVILPRGVRPAKVVKDQPYTNFDGLRAIGIWQERGSRHYHIVVVPEDTRVEKPVWPDSDSEPVEGEEFDESDDLDVMEATGTSPVRTITQLPADYEEIERDIAREREERERADGHDGGPVRHDSVGY